jgi:hypothetical protein
LVLGIGTLPAGVDELATSVIVLRAEVELPELEDIFKFRK